MPQGTFVFTHLIPLQGNNLPLAATAVICECDKPRKMKAQMDEASMLSG